jgi:hypothetical protein
LLRQLGDTASTLRDLTLATCVHAVIDPAARSCVISAAGHLPPVLALPDRITHVPDLPAGPLSGVDPDARHGEARLKPPPGALLALYTDGLAETRIRSFDQGIASLQALLAWHRRKPLEVIADLIVESLAVNGEDDVTVLLARIPDPPPVTNSGKAQGEPPAPAFQWVLFAASTSIGGRVVAWTYGNRSGHPCLIPGGPTHRSRTWRSRRLQVAHAPLGSRSKGATPRRG